MGIGIVLAVLLLAVQIYLLYLIQHYLGINGTEWFWYFGYGLATGFLSAAIKEVLN